ncbi:hypothetical protein AeRB84_015943 [Aphanomyces euteiches]|nr:hypothetical protein AeRB84_015943 [Aphanomyces euteiches]
MTQDVRCDVEIQVALASTGQNISTKRFPNAVLSKRNGGLQVFGERSKTAIRTRGVELYFSQVHRGKLTFIWRDGTKFTQYNCSNGSPTEMQALRDFALRQGAIAKTMQVASTVQATPRPPLRDHTNTVSNLAEDSPPSKKRRLSPPKARQLHQQKPVVKRSRQLTPDQVRVIEAVQRNENVFFTGRAGTGKSFLLRRLQRLLSPVGLYCTATTGIAAFHIHGITLHHFAGLRPNDNLHSVSSMLTAIRRHKDALFRWQNARTLVVDEISMLGTYGRMFEALEAIARALRQSERFFGGIQLILTGDFYQLPPVAEDRQPSSFCFQVDAWKRYSPLAFGSVANICSGITTSISLDQVFRQRDAEFIAILNSIRIGAYSDAMLAKLNARVAAAPPPDAIHIFTHNDDVIEMNKARLDALQGKAHEYAAIDTGNMELLRGSPVPSLIQLKKGAKVMLTKTLSVAAGLVNGARGVVLGFAPETQLPHVRFDHGHSQVISLEVFAVSANQTVMASRQQLPLTLAYAISIHKSQGLTFSTAAVHLAKVFEYGQAYVALSRLSSLAGLTLTAPLTRQAIRVHPQLSHLSSM